MKFSFDKAIEYPVYLRDTNTGEVWEFRNPAELQALETDEAIGDSIYEAYDGGRRKLRISVKSGNLLIERTSQLIESAEFKVLESNAVW